MKNETPEEKWKRLQAEVQQGIAGSYPNPDRTDCINQDGIIELAKRSAAFDDSIEDDPNWQHVAHCSPCYAQYLEEFQRVRQRKPIVSAE